MRRLEAQLDGATSSEVAALRSGKVNLALHAVISRHVSPEERSDVVSTIASYSVRTKDIEALFVALGWRRLVALGDEHRPQRLLLLGWACHQLANLPQGSAEERLRQIALKLPLAFQAEGGGLSLMIR